MRAAVARDADRFTSCAHSATSHHVRAVAQLMRFQPINAKAADTGQPVLSGARFAVTVPQATSAMDAATLSYVYGAMLGFIHGSFGEFFKHEGAVIQSGNFAVTESPLKISVATARLAQLARESGINAEFPTFVAGFFQRAAAAGLGEEEAAALIKVLR